MNNQQVQWRKSTNALKSRPIRLVLLGAPGAGKGTQSELIKATYGVKHLSTGDLLREEVASGSELGMKVGDLMRSGKLVDDESMEGIIRSQFSKFSKTQSFILDGFPRTLAQARFLNDLLQELDMPLTGVINFDVDDETIISRVCGRWIHKSSGRSYHETFLDLQPKRMDRCPKTGDVLKAYDDITNEPLVRRADDNVEAVTARLQSYHAYSKPLIQFYDQMKSETMAFLNIMAEDKFETWSIVQLALGKPEVSKTPVPSPTVNVVHTTALRAETRTKTTHV